MLAIEAFWIGIHRGTPLYKEFTMYPCQTFEGVPMKVMAFRLEEDHNQDQGATERVERRSNGG